MLGNGNRDDLAVFIHIHSDLERRNAGHAVNGHFLSRGDFLDRSSLLYRSLHFSRRSASCGSLSQRVVDGVAGQRHAGLHVDLRGSDVLTDQRAEYLGVVNQVSAQARGLTVLDNLHGHDLASVIHLDGDLHRQEALYLVDRRIRGGLDGLYRRFFNRLNRFGGCRHDFDAVGRGGLHERIVDGRAGQRHAALHIDLRRRQLLTHQRGERLARQNVGAQTRRLVVAFGGDRADLAVGHFNIDGELVKALDGVRIARNARYGLAAKRSGSLAERIVDRRARQRHAALDINLRVGDVLTHQRVKHGGICDQVGAKARRLAMLRNRHGDDLAIRIHGDFDLERRKARHIVGRCTLGGAAAGSLPDGIVDGVARQRHAAPYIDLRGSDILPNQRVKHGGIRDQVSAQPRRLIVLGHGNRDDLAGVIHRHLDLERREARHIVGVRGHNRLSRSLLAAVGRSRCSENRILVTRVRLNAERIAGIGQHVAHSADERSGGNRCATDGIHIVVQRIRIGSDADELIHEVFLANPAAQTGGLLQRADVGLRHIALYAHAERDGDFSAIALRIGHQRIAGELTRGLVRAGKELRHLATLGQTLDGFNLLIFAAGKNLAQRSLLRRDLLLGNRALGHLVGDAQQHSRRE